MAEGNWIMYQSYQEQGHPSADFSLTLAMSLLTSSYTPAPTHSAYSQASANECSSSLTMSNHLMTGVAWTLSATATKLLMDNHNFTSGDGMKAKYAQLRMKDSGRLIAHCDLSAASSTGVDATQINLTLGTITKIKDTNGTP